MLARFYFKNSGLIVELNLRANDAATNLALNFRNEKERFNPAPLELVDGSKIAIDFREIVAVLTH